MLLLSLGRSVDRWPPLLGRSWLDTAPFAYNQRRQPLLLSLGDLGDGLPCVICRSHIHAMAQDGGPASPFLWGPQKRAVEISRFLPRVGPLPRGQAHKVPGRPGPAGFSRPRLYRSLPPPPTPVPRISAAGCPLVPQGHSIVSLSGSAPAHLGICLPTCLLFEAPPWWVGGQQLVRAWGRQWGEATSYLRGAVEFLLDDWVGGSGQGEGSLLRHPLNGLPWGSPVERTGM